MGERLKPSVLSHSFGNCPPSWDTVHWAWWHQDLVSDWQGPQPVSALGISVSSLSNDRRWQDLHLRCWDAGPRWVKVSLRKGCSSLWNKVDPGDSLARPLRPWSGAASCSHP